MTDDTSVGTIQRYRDVDEAWRWRLIGDDGHPMADGETTHPTVTALDTHLDDLAHDLAEAVVATLPTGGVILHGSTRFHIAADGAVDTGDMADSPPTPDTPVIDAAVLAICHRGHDDEWRWTLFVDGQVVAASGEGYADAAAARTMATRTIAAIPHADRRDWG